MGRCAPLTNSFAAPTAPAVPAPTERAAAPISSPRVVAYTAAPRRRRMVRPSDTTTTLYVRSEAAGSVCLFHPKTNLPPRATAAIGPEITAPATTPAAPAPATAFRPPGLFLASSAWPTPSTNNCCPTDAAAAPPAGVAMAAGMTGVATGATGANSGSCVGTVGNDAITVVGLTSGAPGLTGCVDREGSRGVVAGPGKV